MSRASKTDPISAVLDRLKSPKETGNGWSAPCPAHDDKSPSLSVSKGRDGRVLVKCHAGCTVAAITAAMGLQSTDLFADEPISKAKPFKGRAHGEKTDTSWTLTTPAPEKRKVHATKDLAVKAAVWSAKGGKSPHPWKDVTTTVHDYQDDDGTTVMAVVRVDYKGEDGTTGKRLMQIAKVPTGWTVGGVPESGRPLFNLPELDLAGSVLVVEGERCALSGVTLGIVTTTSSQGAESASKTDWSPIAHAKRIVINPDNDDPGRKYANDVARIIRGHNPTADIRILTLPVPESGDLADWVDSHGDAAEPDDLGRRLAEMMDAAPRWEPRVDQEKQPDQAPYSFADTVLDSRTFFTTDYQLRWLVDGLIVEKQPVVLAGPKKVLKTTIATDLAISIASGRSALGRFTTFAPRPVVFISAESGTATLQDAGRRICRSKGIDPAEVLENLSWCFQMPYLTDDEQITSMVDFMATRGKDGVVFIDPLFLGLMAGGNPASVEAGNLYSIGPVLYELASKVLEIGWTPILLHHSKKGTDRDNRAIDLDDLSFAGIAEFARQWVLISRRETYASNGVHHLWLNAGGSAGHSCRYGLNIDEGTIQMKPGSPFVSFDGRQWSVEVVDGADVAADNENRKEERKSRIERDQETRFLNALDRVDPGRRGASERKIRDQANIGGQAIAEIAKRLEGDGIIEKAQASRSDGKSWRRPPVDGR